MRQHFYNFAHKVLPSDVTTQPALWGIISSDKAHSYLEKRWSDAAPASDVQPSKGLMWFVPVNAFGIEVRTVRMPPPDDVTEAYYGAIARSADGAIRYFVCEKSSVGAVWAEWRTNMRIRGVPLEEMASRETNKVFTEQQAQEAPWELSASSIPGMPYLASFLMAVCQEMQNAQANAQAKTSLAAGPGSAPAAPRPKASASNNNVIVVIAAIAVAVIAAILMMR